MAELRARVSHLHKTTEEWDALSDFKPNAAEFVIYDADGINPQRIKIGDGINLLKDLPFYSPEITSIDGGEISTYSSIYDTPEEPGDEIDE